jgi:hypothetical protein
MRAIRELQRQSAPSVDPGVRKWTAASGVTFTVGSIILLIGLVMIGFAYFSRALLQRNLPVRSQVAIDQWLGEIDTAKSADLIDVWNTTVSKGFSDAEDSPYKLFREESRKYEIFMWVGVAAALFGAGTAVSASFLRGSSR